MAEQATAQNDYKAKRFRSAPYPAIDLGKAIERAGELYRQAQHHTVPLHVPANAWGYTLKSGNLNSTIAALKQFGLLRDEGSGHKRRFTLTDDAIRITNDRDPKSDKRVDAVKRAALAPKIHAELWEKFGAAGLSGSMDATLHSYLTVDRKEGGEAPYSEAAADELIEEYKSTISFAGLTNSDFISELSTKISDSSNLGEEFENRFGGAKVGDSVQWEVDGVLKLPNSLRVRKVISHEDQEWVYVEGSKTAIPMSQVIVVRRGDGGVSGSAPPDLDFEETRDLQTWREVTDLDEGRVILTLPERISAESYEDLKTWMDFILKKARRRAGVKDIEAEPVE